MARIARIEIDIEYHLPGDVQADVTYVGIVGERHTENEHGTTLGQILGQINAGHERVERFLDEA